LIPGAPLVGILFVSQALNAVLLLPLLVFIRGLAGDRELMGPHALGRTGRLATAVAIALLGVCVGALLLLSL
jgi:Mn2+/Fe2+ NRAMP family transporter